jgi:ribosomal protein S12 methylthiotransferase
MANPVAVKEAEARRDELMRLQQQISLEKNQALVGKTLPILVEGQGDGVSVGRTYRDAPEVDGLVIVPGELPVGEIVPVTIDGAMAYDLTAYPENTEHLLHQQERTISLPMIG